MQGARARASLKRLRTRAAPRPAEEREKGRVRTNKHYILCTSKWAAKTSATIKLSAFQTLLDSCFCHNRLTWQILWVIEELHFVRRKQRSKEQKEGRKPPALCGLWPVCVKRGNRIPKALFWIISIEQCCLFNSATTVLYPKLRHSHAQRFSTALLVRKCLITCKNGSAGKL